MAVFMKRELPEADLTSILYIDSLFLDRVLPFMITPELLRSLTNDDVPLYDEQHRVWVGCPDLTRITEEGHVANWLNFVCTKLSQINPSKTQAPNRLWSSHFSTKPLGGSATKRKPDIILVNHFTRTGWEWQDVHSLIELTKSAPKGANKTNVTSTIKKTLGDKAFLMFESQQNRRFVLSAALIQTLFHVHLYDRAGVVRMVAFDIHEEPLQFLRFLVGLTFTSSDLIGYDPTIRTSPGRSMTVTVDNTYTIKDTLSASAMIRGRATICWRAERDGREYAIKDSWIDQDRDPTEIELLKEAEKHGVKGIPCVVESKDLMVRQELDTTDSH